MDGLAGKSGPTAHQNAEFLLNRLVQRCCLSSTGKNGLRGNLVSLRCRPHGLMEHAADHSGQALDVLQTACKTAIERNIVRSANLPGVLADELQVGGYLHQHHRATLIAIARHLRSRQGQAAHLDGQAYLASTPPLFPELLQGAQIWALKQADRSGKHALDLVAQGEHLILKVINQTAYVVALHGSFTPPQIAVAVAPESSQPQRSPRPAPSP